MKKLGLGVLGLGEGRSIIYYFRFGGHSHHAGEYQHCIKYFARCLAAGRTPKPDGREGLVNIARIQAMEASAKLCQPVKVKDALARFGLADLLKPRDGRAARPAAK